MTAKIQIRRDTASNWATNDPTLYEGEIGWDTTANQIKIGTGSTWNSTSYLGSTLPYFSSAATSFNDASLRIQGRYYFATGDAMSDGPAAPMEIKALDGGVSLLVLVFGSVVVQRIWTDSDGTQPVKSYSRVYDTAWRTWVAENDFAVDATEGTDLVARSLDIKDDANVDGDLVVKGNTTLGDAAGDHVIVQADTTNAVIYPAGDADTGIAFPLLDQVVVNAGGFGKAFFGPGYVSLASEINHNIALATGGGTGVISLSGGDIQCNSNRVTQVGTPTAATDALRLGDLNPRKLISIVWSPDNATTPTSTDGTSWTRTNPSNFTLSAAGNWVGLVLVFTGGLPIANFSNAVVKSTTTGGTFTIPSSGGGSHAFVLIAIKIP
jgi:hypothetical protein